MTSRDLQALGSLLGETLARLGVGRMDVLLALNDEWDEIAGAPWAGQSSPVILQRGELIVEAANPSGVRFLGYAADDLVRRLTDRFGPHVVDRVQVVAPER